MDGRRPSMRVISIQAQNRAIAEIIVEGKTEIIVEGKTSWMDVVTCNHLFPTGAVPHGHPDQVGGGAPQRDHFDYVFLGQVPLTMNTNLSPKRSYLTPSEKACPISRMRMIPVKMEVTMCNAHHPPICSALILTDRPSVSWCLSIVVQMASPVKEMR